MYGSSGLVANAGSHEGNASTLTIVDTQHQRCRAVVDQAECLKTVDVLLESYRKLDGRLQYSL